MKSLDKPRRKSGFTMMEMLIVVLIIGIVSAVSAPRIGDSLQAINLKSAAMALQLHLNAARNTALTTGRSISVVFDANTKTYYCSAIDYPDQPGRPLLVDLTSVVGPGVSVAVDFSGGNTLTFNYEGSPSNSTGPISSGTITLTLGDQSIEVVINGATGEAKAMPLLSLNSARAVGIHHIAGQTPFKFPIESSVV